MPHGRSTAVAVATALLLALTAAPAHAGSGDRFPRDFLFGVASAGFQSEMGGTPQNADRRTDWWVWTHDRDNIRAGRVTADRPEEGPGFWNRWRGDVDLAARDLHLDAFRFGIEWSRIFPRSTRGATTLRELDRLADRRAVRRYRQILRRIRARGMRPFVTLNHFTLPLWVHDPLRTREQLAAAGADAPVPPAGGGVPRGWLDRATVDEFGKYARYLAWRFGDLVDDWTPLNEPIVVASNGYVNVPGAFAGWFPPGALSYPAALRSIEHQGLANAAAYDALKARDRGDRVGLVVNMIAFTPVAAGDAAATENAERLFNRSFVELAVNGWYDLDADGVRDPGEVRPALARKADFLGVNYYFRSRVTALPGPLTPTIPLLDFLPGQEYRWALAPDAPPCPTTCSDFGNELYPEGMRAVLRTAGSYRLPVIITESGLADASDRLRRRYLPAQLRVLRAAMRDRVADVRGWFHWSLTDNFEWAKGHRLRFGLYTWDRRTLARRARPSARIVARIARTRRVP